MIPGIFFQVKKEKSKKEKRLILIPAEGEFVDVRTAQQVLKNFAEDATMIFPCDERFEIWEEDLIKGGLKRLR